MTPHTTRGRRDDILELFTRFVAERGYDGTNILYQQEDRLATIAFQRETVRFRGDDVMAGSQQLRQRYFTMVREVLQRGMDQGAFRDGDTSLIALAIFGAAQWAWTWFDPDGQATPEEIAAAFVDLYLLGLATDPDTAHQRTSDARRMSTLVRSAIALAASRHQQSPTSR